MSIVSFGWVQGWKDGRVKDGRVEGCKDGRVEGWKGGWGQGWKGGRGGRVEGWKGGRMEGWKGWKGGRVVAQSNLIKPFRTLWCLIHKNFDT